MAVVRIGELARRTGVSPELLRAWEQRYGLLRPERSPGGFRLYSAADEARVRAMTALIADGAAAAEAARQALAVSEPAPEPVPTSAPSAVNQVADELAAALDGFDTEAAHRALDVLFATVSVETVVGGVLVPYLRDLGERWATGLASVALEHFASNLIRGRLLGLGRDWGTGAGPSVLLACLPGESHDIGLVMFGVLVARRGWRVAFLGADTPFDTLEFAVRTVRPSAVVVTTVSRDRFRRHATDIGEVASPGHLFVAAPVDERDVTALGATRLPPDIVVAARSLSA